MKIIGKLTININGTPTEVDITENGCIILPDGRKKKLPERQFELIARQMKTDGDKKILQAARESETNGMMEEVNVQATDPAVVDEEKDEIPDRSESYPNEDISPEMPNSLIGMKQKPIGAAMESPAPKDAPDENAEMQESKTPQIQEQKAEDLKKEPIKDVREMNFTAKKHKSGGGVAAAILAVILGLVIAGGAFSVLSGLVTINDYREVFFLEKKEPEVQEMTDKDLQGVKEVYVVARVVTDDGLIKERVLGQFDASNVKICITEQKPAVESDAEQQPEIQGIEKK